MRHLSKRRRWAAGAIGFVLAAGAAGYVLGTTIGNGSGAKAGPALLDQPSAASEAGTPAGIDTSRPGWDQKYLQQWRGMPRQDQVVNGILVGPTVEPSITVCPGDPRVPASAAAAAGTDMEISAGYLPQGATIEPDDGRLDTGEPAAMCDSAVVLNNARVDLASDPNAAARVASGESWFDVPHGGYVLVSKVQLAADDAPAMRSDVPAALWYAADISGRPAAVGRPVLDGGLGAADLVVWDESSHVETLIHSYNLSLVALLDIAEGLQK